MLVSEKIKSAIKAEVKSQESFIKVLEKQEKDYGANYSKEKEQIKNSIEYYKKILNEA